MTRDIAESDWKRFRQLHVVALERFSEQIMSEIANIQADATKSYHQRYLETYKIIQRRDKEMANLFNDPRRSTALMQIVAIYRHGLLSDDELSGFTMELNQVVDFLLGHSA